MGAWNSKDVNLGCVLNAPGNLYVFCGDTCPCGYWVRSLNLRQKLGFPDTHMNNYAVGFSFGFSFIDFEVVSHDQAWLFMLPIL